MLLLIGLLAVALLLATQVFPTWPQHDLASLGLSCGDTMSFTSGQHSGVRSPAVCSRLPALWLWQAALSQSGGIQAH